MDVIEAIRDRASVRAFVDRPVEQPLVEKVLETAKWAPSGVNTQPWQVAVASGTVKQRIGDEIIGLRSAGQPPHPDYKYYPDEFVEPYRSRRKACGLALYGALGIGREDTEQRIDQWNKNYHGFGAPVELFVLLDQRLEKGSWLDTGMFIQNVMLAARGFGLATCPQAAMAEFPDVVRKHLGLSEELSVVCGIAMGYPNEQHPVNNYRTEREPLESFVTWHD